MFNESYLIKRDITATISVCCEYVQEKLKYLALSCVFGSLSNQDLYILFRRPLLLKANVKYKLLVVTVKHSFNQPKLDIFQCDTELDR